MWKLLATFGLLAQGMDTRKPSLSRHKEMLAQVQAQAADFMDDFTAGTDTMMAADRAETATKTRAAVAAMDGMLKLMAQEMEQLKADAAAEKQDFEDDQCALTKEIDGQTAEARAKETEFTRETKSYSMMHSQELAFEQQASAYAEELGRITKLKLSKGEYHSNATTYWDVQYDGLVEIHVKTQRALSKMSRQAFDERLMVNRAGNVHSEVFECRKPDGGAVCTQSTADPADASEGAECYTNAAGNPYVCTWQKTPTGYEMNLLQKESSEKSLEEFKAWLESKAASKMETKGQKCDPGLTDACPAKEDYCEPHTKTCTLHGVCLKAPGGWKKQPDDSYEIELMDTLMKCSDPMSEYDCSATQNDEEADFELGTGRIAGNACADTNDNGDGASCEWTTSAGGLLWEQFTGGKCKQASDADAPCEAVDADNSADCDADTNCMWHADAPTVDEMKDIVECWALSSSAADGREECEGAGKGCAYKEFQYSTEPDEMEARGAHAAAAIFRIAEDLEKQAIKELRAIAQKIKTEEEMFQEMVDQIEAQETRMQTLVDNAQQQQNHFMGLAATHQAAAADAKTAAETANANVATARSGLQSRQEAFEAFDQDARATLNIYGVITDLVVEHAKIFDCAINQDCLGNHFSGKRNKCSSVNTWTDMEGTSRSICSECDTDADCTDGVNGEDGYGPGYACDLSTFMCVATSSFFLQTGMKVGAPVRAECSLLDNAEDCMAFAHENSGEDGSQCYWDSDRSDDSNGSCKHYEEAGLSQLLKTLNSMQAAEKGECQTLMSKDSQITGRLEDALNEVRAAKKGQFDATLKLRNRNEELATKNSEKNTAIEELDVAHNELTNATAHCDHEKKTIKTTMTNIKTQHDAMKSLSNTVLGLINSYQDISNAQDANLGHCKQDPNEAADASAELACNRKATASDDCEGEGCVWVPHNTGWDDSGMNTGVGSDSIVSAFDDFMTSLADLQEQQATELTSMTSHCATEIASLRETAKEKADNLNTKTIELANAQHALLQEHNTAVQAVDNVNFAEKRLVVARNEADSHLGVCELPNDAESNCEYNEVACEESDIGIVEECLTVSDNKKVPKCTCADENGDNQVDPHECSCGAGSSCRCFETVHDTSTLDENGDITENTEWKCAFSTFKCMGGKSFCRGDGSNTDQDGADAGDKGCAHHTSYSGCSDAGMQAYDNMTPTDDSDDFFPSCEWVAYEVVVGSGIGEVQTGGGVENTAGSSAVCANSCVWKPFQEDSDPDDGADDQRKGPYFDQDGVIMSYEEAQSECRVLVNAIARVKVCLKEFQSGSFGADMSDIPATIAECSSTQISGYNDAGSHKPCHGSGNACGSAPDEPTCTSIPDCYWSPMEITHR